MGAPETREANKHSDDSNTVCFHGSNNNANQNQEKERKKVSKKERKREIYQL